ncbi:MAG: hypothetical protein JOZ32_03105, partial [Bryobacterales bacterium]|nr:hypothetical protein [Bryobacterales bacterium]
LAGAHSNELGGKTEALDRLVRTACRSLCGDESSGLAVGVACFPENGGDADSLIAFAEQSLARDKEVRRASRNVLLQLEHSVRGPG